MTSVSFGLQYQKATHFLLHFLTHIKQNLDSNPIEHDILTFLENTVCSISNFYDVSLSFRHGEHVQCGSEESAQEVESFQDRQGTSREPGA